MSIKIIVTGEKGGTGKSTITALLLEYLDYLNKPVNILDADPLQIARQYVNNCLQEGRKITEEISPQYLIVDTAGASGASLAYLKEAHKIIVPFIPHYADLSVIIPWFTSLNKTLQQKIYFLPNRYQKTKEQQEGIKQLAQIIKEEGTGKLLLPLTNKPALYGTILNGSQENFFTKQNNAELINTFNIILEISDEKIN